MVLAEVPRGMTLGRSPLRMMQLATGKMPFRKVALDMSLRSVEPLNMAEVGLSITDVGVNMREVGVNMAEVVVTMTEVGMSSGESCAGDK